MTNLIELLKANPELPVYACVDSDVIGSRDFVRWIGDFGFAEIREFADVEPYGCYDQRMVFKNEIDVYEESFDNANVC